jgi:hypothetical protein
MDGMNTTIIEIQREALRLSSKKWAKLFKIWKKDEAIRTIRMQPYFGEYWPKKSDTIKIRRHL